MARKKSQSHRTRADSSPARGSRLADLIRTLPGYDPYAQAGDCRFDEKAAQAAIDFVHECIRHAKGPLAGKPFLLADWQKAVVGNLFGWKRPDGTRRYRESLIYVPKKNGKTAMVAALLLLVLCTDGEYGAELYSAAASRDQAALIFSHAAGMVRLEPQLSSRLTVFGARGGSQQRAIIYDAQMASYKCLSADANTADGTNPSFVAIDELHRHRDSELSDVLQKSTATRSQPLVIYTTTADYNRPSACNDMLKRARNVRDNPGDPARPGYDPAFLPVIYEAGKDNDWESPEVWRKANPNFGVTVSQEFLARECQKAKENPSELNNFLRLHLNIVTDAAEAWLDKNEWDACGGGVEIEDGDTCYGALDLSTKIDVTAWVLVFPPAGEGGRWRVLPRFFIPAANAREREKKDRVPYTAWARAGWLTLTDGNVVDYEAVKAKVMEDCRRFDVREIAFDPWNATQIGLQLQAEGLEVVEFGQGFRSMSEPAKELEKLIAQRAISHDGNEVMRWMVGNVMLERDPAGNIKPSKKVSTERIDGVVAMVMALGRAIVRGGGEAMDEIPFVVAGA